MKRVLKNWNKATQELAQAFVDKYYNNSFDEEDRIILTAEDWVGQNIGGTLEVNDHFHGVDFMRQALSLNATEKQVFDFYYDSIEDERKITCNFENYVYYYKTFKK